MTAYFGAEAGGFEVLIMSSAAIVAEAAVAANSGKLERELLGEHNKNGKAF